MAASEQVPMIDLSKDLPASGSPKMMQTPPTPANKVDDIQQDVGTTAMDSDVPTTRLPLTPNRNTAGGLGRVPSNLGGGRDEQQDPLSQAEEQRKAAEGL